MTLVSGADSWIVPVVAVLVVLTTVLLDIFPQNGGIIGVKSVRILPIPLLLDAMIVLIPCTRGVRILKIPAQFTIPVHKIVPRVFARVITDPIVPVPIIFIRVEKIVDPLFGLVITGLLIITGPAGSSIVLFTKPSVSRGPPSVIL